MGVSGNVHAAANDFTFTNFEVDYYLTKDTSNRSVLRTVERLSAEFPQSDQNHGIERAIPTKYDGHSTNLKIVSVTDEQGKTLPYTTYQSNNNEVVRIGDAERFVHGAKTYVLTYVQRDVTKSVGGVDEFYWDTNGTEWTQPFASVAARLHVSRALEEALLNGQTACYLGEQGATGACRVARTDGVLSAKVTDLQPGENMTLAVGFKAGTFAPYEPTVWERILHVWLVSLIPTSIAGVAAMVWLTLRYYRWSNRKQDIGTVPTEYIPPKGVSVLVAEQVGEGTRAGMTAQIIDLAVRHYLKVYQVKEKSTFRNAEYELELTKSIDLLSDEERTFVQTLFGENNTQVGSRFEMKKLQNDYKLAGKFTKNRTNLQEKIRNDYGFRRQNAVQVNWFMRTGHIILVLGLLTLSPAVIIAAITAYVSGKTLHPLTDKGLDLRRYLQGLKRYIGVAEEARLAMLQSPEGAEKAGDVRVDNPKQLVKLYERVLPYAVLFGQEKEWNKHLGQYYEQAQLDPSWYSGQAAFNAVVFSSAMNDFSTTTNSYAAATSSTGGGSTGGGASGGGGGGGGGGGW